MDEKLFSARMAEYKSAVDKYLDACLLDTQCASYHKLTDSMHYSLTAGGKRLRAILVLEFCRICGGDVEKALPVACGVEMLHTYSLIHDDLPVMDNDDLRRGKPSNHKVFGECTATLAGDALQALAFETILKADLPALRALKCAQILANAAGHEGICGGQQLDLEWEGKILSAPELEEIYLRKTSALIRAACLMGVAAAGGGVAIGGKVQADGVQQRGSGSLKAVPVAGHQAAALLVLDHQRLGGVPARQVCLGKARVGNDFDVRRDVQCVQRADRVRRGTVAPVLPVQQGDGLTAAQTQRPREGVDEHLVAEAPGQFGVDHACPPSLSYSCSMRRAAVFSSYPAAESAAQWSS